MRKANKIKREIRKHRLLDMLSEIVYGDGHPLNIRFLAAKKMLEVYAADGKELKIILQKYRKLLD